MSEEVGEFGVLVQFGILVSECREEEGKGREGKEVAYDPEEGPE